MTSFVPYAIWAVLILTGLSLLTMGIFSIKALIQGKVEPLTIVLVALPILLLAILGFVMGDWAEAAIMAFLIAFGLTSGALFLSGIRGLIGF